MDHTLPRSLTPSLPARKAASVYAPIRLALVLLGGLALGGCGGGAVGSSSGTSATPSASETLAQELFQAPDPSFDRSTIEGLYQLTMLSATPIRVRITGNTIAIAHKTEGGALVGAQANAQISPSPTGAIRWDVILLESVSAKTADPCVDRFVELRLSAGTFTLTLDGPGNLRGMLPIQADSSRCPTSTGSGDTGSAGDSNPQEGFVLTKIGK